MRRVDAPTRDHYHLTATFPPLSISHFSLPTAKGQNLKQFQDAFRREISPEKGQRMRSARTLPFSWPAGGKVALKVVDHNGVEHLTVLDRPNS